MANMAMSDPTVILDFKAITVFPAPKARQAMTVSLAGAVYRARRAISDCRGRSATRVRWANAATTHQQV